MNNSSPFIWDKYSDQPYVIKNKSYKRAMRKRYKFDFLKMLLTNIILFPLSVLLQKLFRKNDEINISDKGFYGLGVNLDKGDLQQALIEELRVKSLLMRIPLYDVENIEKYYEFAQSFGDDKSFVIVIVQDRENIENHELLKSNMKKIFSKFSSITKEYQIGIAINRAKWGFFAVEEYLKFYKVVSDVRDDLFKDIELIGPSVIDFEYHYTIRALFNNYDVTFDKLSSLLYVDRRGAPQNKQMGIFDTKNKVDMLYSIVKLSPKMKSDTIYITEVNWPLSNTAPYAPTSEKECVSEELYSKYMLDYFDIVKQTKKVKKVFWHQLIAPGYGLVDNRDGKIRKTKAFYSFKKMMDKG
jgi:hypothetical protein